MHEKTAPALYEKIALTLPELLARGASDAPALLAPDRTELTFRTLREQVYALAEHLASIGLGGNRIAVVMENGPDLVLSLLAASLCGTAVPLNPKYRAEEFSFYYEDANVKGLIAVPGTVPDALAAVPPGTIVVHAVADQSGVLCFEPAAGPGGSGRRWQSPDPDDVAILLHTSGTTRRPKGVPIRHRNVTASAANIVNACVLTPDDRSLCVMPLRSEEHTSELQSHSFISYAVFCLKKKNTIITNILHNI